MSIIPELEVVEKGANSVRYLEHGWPDARCRWHSHKECELHLIVATKGKAFIGDYIGDFDAGELFLTGPYLPHNWITDEVWHEDVELRDMVVQFDHERIETLIGAFPEFADLRETIEMSRSGVDFVGFDAKVARGFFERIRDTTGHSRVFALLEFLSAVHKHAHKRTLSVAKVHHGKRNEKQERICEVVDFIVKNFAEEISVNMAADKAGMTATSFSRNFQAVTGNRFVEFVNRVRIGQACGMLYATDDPVSSICFDVGYQNLANFNRHFLKMKEMTPSNYRDLARQELKSEGARAL